MAIASAIGHSSAANLSTLFLFYEILMRSTYPLVTCKGTPEAVEAVRGGRIYLMRLIGTSVLLLLPATIGTAMFAGTTDFKAGGILPANLDPISVMGGAMHILAYAR